MGKSKQYAFGLHVKPEVDRYTLVFFDPEKELAEELLKYDAGGLLKVSGDKLTVCLCLDPSKGKKGEEFPDDFKAGTDSGHLLLEFQREKVAGRPVAAADPLRAMLEKKGYVAVPLTAEEGGVGFIVECKRGTETLRLLIDTGAEVSALDMSLVKKLSLKPKRKVTGVGIGGEQDGVEVSLRGLSIGDFDTRTTANAIPFAALDFTAINTALVQHRKLRPIDGLLGHIDLRDYSAVIDYSTQTLYLRRPSDVMWPEIEGRWVATGGQEDGGERKIDPKAPPRLEFEERLFDLTYGTKLYRFGLHVKPGKDHYTIGLFDPWKQFDGELDYRAGGLLKVTGDKLTVCLALDPTKAKAMPGEFKAAANSGFLLLEFRREK